MVKQNIVVCYLRQRGFLFRRCRPFNCKSQGQAPPLVVVDRADGIAVVLTDKHDEYGFIVDRLMTMNVGCY